MSNSAVAMSTTQQRGFAIRNILCSVTWNWKRKEIKQDILSCHLRCQVSRQCHIYTNDRKDGWSCMRSYTVTIYGPWYHLSVTVDITIKKPQTEQWSLNDLGKYLVLCEISSQTQKQEYSNAVLDFHCLITAFTLNFLCFTACFQQTKLYSTK